MEGPWGWEVLGGGLGFHVEAGAESCRVLEFRVQGLEVLV